MRVLCILLVCLVAFGYALPPRYYAVPGSVDDDDDADVQDSPYSGADDDMYTFPIGGPVGPPSNRFISGVGGPLSRQARTGNEVSTYLGKYYFDEDTKVLYQKDDGTGPLSPDVARQLLRMRDDKKEVAAKEEEEAVEDEEDQEDEEEDEDDDADDEPDYAVPDMTKLFPNPDNRPRGPGDYAAYMKHMPQRPATAPAQRRYTLGPVGQAPPRRYRFISPTGPYVNTVSDLYDTVVIDANDNDKSRILYDEVEEDEDAEDDVDQDDDADFIPEFDTLFPRPDQKQGANTNLFGNVASTWNSARPPGRYGRVVRLFQSPIHHDVYNPDYVIDPIIAQNRRNERMKNRYSHPGWRMQNIKTPWNYKPILYQQGHWGNPRENDYNPWGGQHYTGGIYNGKNYVPQY